MDIQHLEGDIWVVTPGGRVDSATARVMEESILQLIGEGRHRLIVDFSDVPYMASAGLRALILAQRKAQAAGGGIRLVNASPTVRELFEIAGLTEMFTLYASRAEAAAEF